MSAHFGYIDGRYHVEQVALGRICAAIGTPVYVYSAATVRDAFLRYARAFAEHDVLVCYALKANSNQSIVRLLGELGAGADVVSEGELRRALGAGIAPEKIVFSGVGKSKDEIRFALGHDIRQFNVESEPELDEIAAQAVALGRRARIAFRVNPDIDAGTHEKISTGKSENKFGLPLAAVRDAYARAARLDGIDIVGVDLHIGSQILSLAPYRSAFERMRSVVDELRRDGHEIGTIDVGGGLGIDYEAGMPSAPTIDSYAALVTETLGDSGCRLIVEPGRSLLGPAGVLASEVLYVKEGTSATFLIVDAAMNDLIRPAMYGAYHAIVAEREAQPTRRYDVVGPVCETGDTFARSRLLPTLSAGDLIVFEDTGAYGSAMASCYNSRRLVPEVMVDGSSAVTIRQRESYDDLLARDVRCPLSI